MDFKTPFSAAIQAVASNYQTIGLSYKILINYGTINKSGKLLIRTLKS